MDHKYWVVFIILIAIMLYSIISYQWLMGFIACIVVIIVAAILSWIQQRDKTHTSCHMDRKYWILFIILIAIMLYSIISYQWLMGFIACILVIIVAAILSQVQHWGKTHT